MLGPVWQPLWLWLRFPRPRQRWPPRQRRWQAPSGWGFWEWRSWKSKTCGVEKSKVNSKFCEVTQSYTCRTPTGFPWFWTHNSEHDPNDPSDLSRSKNGDESIEWNDHSGLRYSKKMWITRNIQTWNNLIWYQGQPLQTCLEAKWFQWIESVGSFSVPSKEPKDTELPGCLQRILQPRQWPKTSVSWVRSTWSSWEPKTWKHRRHGLLGLLGWLVLF